MTKPIFLLSSILRHVILLLMDTDSTSEIIKKLNTMAIDLAAIEVRTQDAETRETGNRNFIDLMKINGTLRQIEKRLTAIESQLRK